MVEWIRSNLSAPFHGMSHFVKDVPAHASARHMRSTHNMTTFTPISPHLLHNLTIESCFKLYSIAHMNRCTNATPLKYLPFVTRVLNHHAVKWRQLSWCEGFYTDAFSAAVWPLSILHLRMLPATSLLQTVCNTSLLQTASKIQRLRHNFTTYQPLNTY